MSDFCQSTPPHQGLEEPDALPSQIRTLIYQVFPERFAPKPGGYFQHQRPEGIPPHLWHAGGHLDGITSKLEYIVELGADAIYSTPILPAPSNHKYDSESFCGVDERFGGMAAFQRLSAACAERGLGLILDAVFNHVGCRHEWALEAQRDPDGLASARFRRPAKPHVEYPVACWRGHKSLPELDTASEDVVSLLLDDPDSPFHHWLDKGITGWRLDCANDLGFEFCRRATRLAAARRAATGQPVDGVIGEVMAFAADWTRRRTLDGVMNYWFREAVLGLVDGRLAPSAFREAISVQCQQFPHDGLVRSWNILSSHDTPRLATLVPDVRMRRMAFALQFFLPGVPVLYYGEELGMSGGPDPDNRRPMPWHEVEFARTSEGQLSGYIQRLAQLRRERPCLRNGLTRFAITNPQSGLVAILRVSADNPTDFALLLINPTDRTCQAEETVLVPCDGMFDGMPLVNALGSGRLDALVASSGAVRPRYFPAHSTALYVPEPMSIPGYSFFKPCWNASMDHPASHD